MKLNCPVCARDVEVKEDLTCPVCESDLSLLVRYRESSTEKAGGQKGMLFLSRYWWLILIVFAVPVIWLIFFRNQPTPVAEVSPIVETATNTINDPTATLTPTQIITPTQTQAEPATPDVTEELILLTPPSVDASQNVNCRVGPSSTYPVSGYLMEGSTALVNAVLADQTWFLIENPQNPAHGCWVWSGAVTVDGALDLVPVILPSQ